MKRGHTLPLLLFLLCAASAHAQLYKWVGPDGKVTYTDTPPPASAKQVESKSIAAGGPGGSDFPYELSEPVKSHPVTIYTASKCVPCDEGRKLLDSRGIPFTEKTVNSSEDIARLREIGGDTQLPLLIIGRTTQKGFSADGWGGILTAAGYPEASKLPKNYRNPPTEAAAPTVKPAAPAQANGRQTAARPPDDLPPAIGNAPPGFRF